MQDAFIGFVIDRSGSMASQIAQTVDGFNGFVKEQIAASGDAKTLASVLLFDDEFLVPFVAQDLTTLPAMSALEGPLMFKPRNSTALYDAVGTMIKGMEAWQKKHPNFDGRFLVVIMTDGQENHSREWHISSPADPEDDRDLNNLISYKQGEGWDFVFMGAGEAAWRESRQFSSIAASNTVNYSGDYASGVGTYSGVSRSLSSSRVSGQAMASSMAVDPLLAKVRVDHKDQDATSAPKSPLQSKTSKRTPSKRAAPTSRQHPDDRNTAAAEDLLSGN